MNQGPGPYRRAARRREFFGIVHQLLPLAASAVQIPDDVNVDGQSDILVHARSAIYDSGQANIRFEKVPGGFESTAEKPISALGSGQFPFPLPTPQLLVRGSTYRLIANDRQLVAAANNIRILHIGQKVYDDPFEPAKQYYSQEPFDYIADFTAQGIGTVAANGTLPFANVIDAEADFDVYEIAIIADGDCTVEIETSGKALKWFNKPCHVGLLGATQFEAAISAGSRPFRLPSPVLVSATGVIQTTIANLRANAIRAKVIYSGVKLKPPRGVTIHEGL